MGKLAGRDTFKTRPPLKRVAALMACGVVMSCPAGGLARPIERQGLGGLEPVPIERLTDRHVTALGAEALRIRPDEWLHAETENFVYHFFPAFEGSPTSIATAVSVEAEYYYRVFAAELDKETEAWERKSHIFIFDARDDWKAFQSRAQLDPWTGGIHAQGELFLPRPREMKFKGHTLGHEVAHLVVHRFYGGDVPLWLNEGYAEYASRRAHASYHRARGYAAKPSSPSVDAAALFPLGELAALRAYPVEKDRVGVFYRQSEKTVRFLAGEDPGAFAKLFELLAAGRRFESALPMAYPRRFRSVSALESELADYMSREIVAQ